MKRLESYQSLGDSVEIINGFPAKSSYFNSEDVGLPLIRIRNVTKGYSDTYYSGEYQDKYLIDKGDILIGMDGEFNIAKWSGSKSLLNQRVCKIKNVVPPFNIDYVYYQLQVDLKKIEARTPSTTVKHLSIKDIRKLRVYCPPLPEQQKIAEILSTVDEQISATERIIEKSKELKKGLMQKLFSQGIGHTEFKDTQIGRIPKDWDVVRLDSISDKIGDGLHSTPKYTDESEYYFVNGNNLINGRIKIQPNTKKVTEEEFIKHKKELSTSTILMSINGTIGNLAFYNMENVVLGKSAAYINLNESMINKLFFYYYLQTRQIKLFYLKELTGTTIANLSLKSIRKTPTVLPSMEEQQKIVEILSEADKKIEKEEQYKFELEELKKGLMQQLLTGQKRVKV